MNHDVLGEIKGDSDDGEASVDYDSRKIDVQIISDDQPFETALNLAVDVVARLAEYDAVAKQILVTDLRDKYNSGWNEYDETQDDGSFTSVTNPQLSEADFGNKFSLSGISITGNAGVDLIYNDSGLFWGHSVIVSSLNGMDFSDAYAELLG